MKEVPVGIGASAGLADVFELFLNGDAHGRLRGTNMEGGDGWDHLPTFLKAVDPSQDSWPFASRWANSLGWDPFLLGDGISVPSSLS